MSKVLHGHFRDSVRHVRPYTVADVTPRATRDDNGPATRTLVASFSGTAYVAEREEGGALNIYLITEDRIPSMSFGDHMSSFDRGTMLKGQAIQKRNEEFRREEARRDEEYRRSRWR